MQRSAAHRIAKHNSPPATWLSGDDLLELQTATIHLILKANDRRPAVLPCQSTTRRASPDDFVGKKRVQVMNRIDMRRSRCEPLESQCRHSTLHLVQNELGLFAKSRNTDVAETDDVIPVVRPAFGSFAASRNHEARRRVRRCFSVTEGVKRGFRGGIRRR